MPTSSTSRPVSSPPTMAPTMAPALSSGNTRFDCEAVKRAFAISQNWEVTTRPYTLTHAYSRYVTHSPPTLSRPRSPSTLTTRSTDAPSMRGPRAQSSPARVWRMATGRTAAVVSRKTNGSSSGPRLARKRLSRTGLSR